MSLFAKLFKLTPVEEAERAHARGKHAKAVQLFTALIDNPRNRDMPPSRVWTLYLHRGLSLRRLGRREEALRDYKKASELNPSSHKPHLNSALILAEDMHRHAQARAEFEQACRLSPEDLDSHMCLGLALLELGLNDEGEHALRKALDIDPGNWMAQYNLGHVCLTTGRLEEAVDLLTQAQGVNPRDPDIRRCLSMAEARLAGSGAPRGPSRRLQ